MSIDVSGAIYADYKKNRKKADRLREAGSYDQAARLYRRCAQLLEQYGRSTTDRKVRAQQLERAEALRSLADKLSQGPQVSTATESGSVQIDADGYQEAVRELVTRSPVTWADIGGLQETIQEIKTAYGLSLVRKPHGVDLRGWRNMLFYGPPGTGKTLLAAATSNGLSATFFSVKVSNVISKYFGESSKLITALYEAARQQAPSVIFLDEFESLSPQRGSDDSGAERRIVSTLLAELDGLAAKKDDRYVLTIGATNTPWLIDKAILSRFEKKIYIPLPDKVARRAILELLTEKQGHRLTVPLDNLVSRTEGYSGRELERLCREAINHMIARANPDLASVVDRGQSAISAYELKVDPLRPADFDHAFSRVKPETSSTDLAAFERWQEGES